MASPETLFTEWLMDDALFHVERDAVREARWGDDAIETERMTVLASKSGAIEEGQRQLAFLGGPLVEERHVVKGKLRPYLGKVITVTIADLGYDAGLDVFLLSAVDDILTGFSQITVLRRL